MSLDSLDLDLDIFCHFGQMMVYHVAQIYIYDMWSLAGMMEQILSSLSYMEKNQGVKVLR